MIKQLLNIKKAGLLLTVLILAAGINLFAEPKQSPFGADAAPDLFSAALMADGFITTTGGAPVSAINPAQGGDAHRTIFDFSYIGIGDSGGGKEEELNKFLDKKGGYMQVISFGALFPTTYGVFGGSLRYVGGFTPDQFSFFQINPTFGGNIFASKEVYPGMSVGAGFNFGFITEPTLSADIGFRYNIGNLAFLENFTIGVVLGNLGISYFPTWLTPAAGVSFDLVNIKGEEGKKDPFVLTMASDLSFPSLFYPKYANLIFKAGLKATIAELITISASWPGGSGLNTRELAEDPDFRVAFPVIPAIGISFNFMLPSGGERIAGGRLPSDGDLKISGGFKPLYEGIAAYGGGVSWHVGKADTTPPAIDLSSYNAPGYFSPNNDGKADLLEIPVVIKDDGFVVSWSVEIKDERGNVVKVIENKEPRFEQFNMKDFFNRLTSPRNQIELPSVITWDGLRTDGQLATDGKYFFTITATDNADNTFTSEAFEAVLKNTPPNVTVNALTEAQRIFDPKGQGGNRTVTFTPRGSAEDAWESGMYNVAGERVRRFDTQSGAPTPITWDGRNDAGDIAADGVYSFRISATDKAMNSADAEITNIILDSREAGVFITSSVSAVRPAENQSTNVVDFSIRLLLTDGIDNWRLELKDETGTVQRAFTGSTRVPSVQGWNGLTEQGEIREGRYTPELTVTYTRGDVIRATATTVLVDVSGPVLTVVTSPEYFSPDNDGENDELFINLTALDASPIANWVFEIREPRDLAAAPSAAQTRTPVFRRIEGRGTPSSRIVWDGRSDRGELVQSAMDYPYTFTATDALGNTSSVEGRIGVDVLVIRDGDRLRIQIPAIIFRPDHADFVGLSQEIIDNNNRIIRRLAQILNQFRDYRIQVEGHANAIDPPGPARDRREAELQRISEARARAIVDMLVRNGVTRSRLTATGVGSTKPVATFEDRDNWWKNRRVEFYLIR